MKMTAETIYNQYAKSDEYALTSENEKTLEAWENLKEALMNNLTQSAFLEIEEMVVNAIIVKEELGFINGFRCAMQMITDCIPQVIVERLVMSHEQFN